MKLPIKWLRSKFTLPFAFIISWAVTYIFLTPYCGALFHCGCTWLWAGGAAKCIGAMDGACKMHTCPWCSDGQLGMMIPLIFMLIFQTIAISGLWWKYRINILLQLLVGIIAFLASGYLEAIVHGLIKHYPR